MHAAFMLYKTLGYPELRSPATLGTLQDGVSFFLSPFPVPPFCLFPGFGRVRPSIPDSKFPIQLEILNSKFLILNSFFFSS